MLTLPFEESLPKMPESPSIRSGSFPQLDTCSRASKPRLLHHHHQQHDTNHQVKTSLLHQQHLHDTNHQVKTSLLLAVKPTEDQLLESESNQGDEEEEEDEDEGFQGLQQQDENGVPRRQRGPRKKMSRARQDRIKVRRMEANTRERNRMHGLNNALDSLRKVVPCYSKTQKLSKIETLRLAKNYIWALSEILSTGKRPDLLTFVQTLCRGISQPTTNLVAGCLQLNARNFIMAEQQDAFAGRSPFDALYPPYHHHHLHHHHHHHHTGDGESATGVDKPFRPYGAYYDTFYESVTSPERSNSSPPIFEAGAAVAPSGTLSPPLNFNGIFSLKHEEGGVRDYGKSSCHYGAAALRYSAAPASTGGRSAGGTLHGTVSRGGSAPLDIHPYDVHLRGQFYPLNDDINTPFHD